MPTSAVVLPEVIVNRLSAEISRASVTLSTELSHRLTGQSKPVVQVEPASEEDMARIAKCACEERWVVSPMGNGSQTDSGNIPDTIDIALCTHRMNQVLEYSPSDLVVTVQPGMLWEDFQKCLAQEGQMLPLDPVCPPTATVGGVVSTAASGPMRAAYGTLRDMTIGLRVVYPDGRVIKTGGKVVKNVAGYDMTKLFIGAYGTLGILSEITFKLRPLPSHQELCLLSGPAHAMSKLSSLLIHSNLVPTRAELLSGPYDALSSEPWTFAVECGETEAASAYQTRRLAEWAKELGLHFSVHTGEDVSRFWTMYRSDLNRAECAIRFSAPPTEILSIGEGLRLECKDANSTRYLSIGATTGVGRLYLSGASVAEQERVLTKLRARTAQSSGFTVLEKAPLALRRNVDAFGPPRADRRIMQGIKSSVDPHHILNPHRLTGGI